MHYHTASYCQRFILTQEFVASGAGTGAADAVMQTARHAGPSLVGRTTFMLSSPFLEPGSDFRGISVNFRNQIIELLDIAVTPGNATEMIAFCNGLEQDHPYIPSDLKWVLDYKRFQAEIARGAAGSALAHIKAAIALAPYHDDLQKVYRQLIKKSPVNTSLALIISCKRYEENARRLAVQLDTTQLPYLIITGNDTAPIDHPRAVQVDAPDNYEGLPRKLTAAFQWVYENIDSQVGVLKLDDDHTVVDPARLLATVNQLKREDVYAGFPVATLSHDRCWHWNKCQDPALNRAVYGKPFVRPWARGGVYYLGAGPLEKFVSATTRFPGLLAGEFYEDKLVGDVLGFENVPLRPMQSEAEFGLNMDTQHRFIET